MEEEIEFLEFFHNVIKLEKDAIARLRKIRDKDDILSTVLKEQSLGYKKFDISVTNMIENRKKKTSNLNLIAKIASDISVKLVVSENTDIDTIYKLLLKRYNICIDEINEKIKGKNITNKRILNLTSRFIAFEEQNIVALGREYQFLKNKKVDKAKIK